MPEQIFTSRLYMVELQESINIYYKSRVNHYYKINSSLISINQSRDTSLHQGDRCRTLISINLSSKLIINENIKFKANLKQCFHDVGTDPMFNNKHRRFDNT